jgi:lipid-binding SYLF domain-containing protein
MTLAAAVPAVAGDGTAMRLERAAAVLHSMTEPAHGIKPQHLAGADCIVVMPGFKIGAAVVGVGYGRGYMSCRKGDGWSAPAAMVLEGGSVGLQIGGESIDIVILSMDKEYRSKLWEERFALGSEASAAWGNGKSAHEDPNAKFLFYGIAKGVFGGFGLDGAALKRDASGNRALYRKNMTTYEVVDQTADTPEIASRFIAALPRE